MGEHPSADTEQCRNSNHSDSDLSEEDIQRLLREAESRLRAGTSKSDGAHAGEAPATKRYTLPKHEGQLKKYLYLQNKNGTVQAAPNRIVDGKQRQLANNPHFVKASVGLEKTNERLTAGPQWFDMPRTDLTSQVKRDFQMLEMRSVLDPHRHYKKDSHKGKTSAFSQVGTVIEGPTEWYTARINKKARAKNFVDEAMTTEQQTGRFRRKYVEIQEAKTSGKKAHYKRLKARRKKP